jgi:4-carboxymuconolactone decarboxylase
VPGDIFNDHREIRYNDPPRVTGERIGEPVTFRPFFTSTHREEEIVREKAMENLSKRDLELVALGASLGSNCVPCIAYHIREVRKCGVPDSHIREAIEVADKIRKVPADLVRNTAFAHLEEEPSPPPAADDADRSCCGC